MSKKKSNPRRKKTPSQKKTARPSRVSRTATIPVSSIDSVTTKKLIEADKLMQNGRYEEALAVAEPLWEKISSDDGPHYLALARVLGQCTLRMNRVADTLDYISEALTMAGQALDFHFLAALALGLSDRYHDARPHCEAYLQRYDAVSAGKAAWGHWDETRRVKFQILNALGIALIEDDDHNRAEQAFREAIDLAPDYDSSYVNLNVLYTSQNRHKEATAVIQQGLKQAPESAQLRQLAGSRGTGSTVSVCMIVKNEEEFLPRCLKSVAPFADEIIVVDTGSEDRTVAIAEEHGAIVHHYPWQGDFSSARNESLKYATKDWVFIIDADEEVPAEDIEKLRFFLKQPDISVFSISVYNKSLQTGTVSSFLPSVRFFRRRLNLRYYGIVHNRLKIPKSCKIIRSSVRLFHYGYDLAQEKMARKIDRTRALLEKQLELDPSDVYANFNMAQLLFGYGLDDEHRENCELIVEHAGRVLANPISKTRDYRGQRLMAYLQRASALIALRHYDEAETLCKEALNYKEDYLDAVMILGHCYFEQGRMSQSRQQYEEYLRMRRTYKADDEVDNVIMRYLDSEHIAWFGLAMIDHMANNTDAAIESYLHVLETQEFYRDTFCRLGKLSFDKEEYSQAEQYFRRELEISPESVKAWFGLGLSCEKLEQLSEAAEAMKAAARFDPGNTLIAFQAGKTCLLADDIVAGRELLMQTVSARDITAPMLDEVADLLYTHECFTEAIGVYERLISVKPDHLDARSGLANCYARLKDDQRAITLYRELIRMNPNYIPPYRNLGVILARQGKTEEALTYLLTYAQVAQKDTDILRLVGELLLAIGQYADAVPSLEAYLRDCPGDYLTLFNLAEAYNHLGFTDAAEAGYRQVMAMAPDFAQAHERLRDRGMIATATEQ